ncbi:EpsI family protein, partial [bacterium]|nr:EpsI family protein [bacterium]
MKSQARNSLLMVLGLTVILGSGVVQGIQGGRWGNSESLMKAAQRLDEIPRQFGDWTSTENEMSLRELQIAEAVGHFTRTFVNSKTGKQISVMILCGKPGPISVHPPTVCFVGAGWGLESEPTVTNIEPEDGSFWAGRFSKNKDGQRIVMETKWGWSSSSHWKAFENARLETAGQSFLYKMYISAAVIQSSENVGTTEH